MKKGKITAGHSQSWNVNYSERERQKKFSTIQAAFALTGFMLMLFWLGCNTARPTATVTHSDGTTTIIEEGRREKGYHGEDLVNDNQFNSIYDEETATNIDEALLSANEILPEPESGVMTQKEIREATPNADLSEKEYSKLELSDYEIAAWLLKAHEGIHLEPYWDINRWSYGYGTKAVSKHSRITFREAEAQVKVDIQKHYDVIRKKYKNLDRFTTLIVAVLDYNIGSIGKNLDAALKVGNKKRIAKWIRKYNKSAKGDVLLGLVKRRNMEADLILADEYGRQEIGRELREIVRIKNAIVMRLARKSEYKKIQ